MSVRYTSPARQPIRPAGLSLLVVLALGACILMRAPANTLAAGGVWKGTAEGISVDDGELQSGEVTSSSVSNYQVELSFSFSVSPRGDVSGGGSGYYTDAHWHLSGINGKEGSFNCEPPVSAEPFKVEVSGHRSGHDVLLTLAIPDATETNQDYECGANYSGFATTTHLMSESLKLVGADQLHLSTTAPTSRTLEKTVESGSAEDHETDLHIWSFSIAPPRSDSNSGSGSGEGGSGSCSLSLSHVAAKPSPGRAGEPIAVSFHVSAPASTTLLVAPIGGPASTVVSRNVPRGPNELVWGGWLGKLPAPAGRYALTVTAKACGKTRTQAVTVTTQ
jgi:hypothetical protein